MRAHTLDMTVGSPARLLLRFSLPLFVGNLLQQVYNLADTAIAGHLLGDAALSQIGATAALYSLITTLAFGLNSGFALSVSRHFGANDRKRMEPVRLLDGNALSCCAPPVMTAVFLLSRFALADASRFPPTPAKGLLLSDRDSAGHPRRWRITSNRASCSPSATASRRCCFWCSAASSTSRSICCSWGRSASAWAARRRRRCLRRAQRGAWAVLHSPPRT